MEECKIKNLYNLEETIAYKIFEGATYPWEVLSKIESFIIELGKTLNEDEYEKVGEDVWIAKSATVAPTAYIKGPAIIGKNASGKSTLIKLLLKFYEPEKGKILINNIDICKIETKSLREKFGVVPQKNEVFEGTLNNNITLEDKSISPEELNKIKKVASLQEFGESNRKILYKGNNISGGQKQRIAIARALIKKTDVLVLDEAYASLDINTQETIKNNILKDYNNTIIIDIGQKIEDRIIQKRIVEL